MENLIINLENLGFSQTEAKVYLTLLNNGKLNGYQVSKILTISKSSSYSALNNLYKKNMVYLIPEEDSSYYPEKPDVIFKRLVNKFEKSVDEVLDKLENIDKEVVDQSYYNIYGFDNNVEKVKEIINEAKDEICINTEIEIELFEKELRKALERGVRILMFAMHKIDIKDIPIELYCFQNNLLCESSKRMLMVADYNIAHIFGGDAYSEVVGTFSENENLISMVSQHIAHDIYTSKLFDKSDKSPITESERVHSIEENMFFDKIKFDLKERIE